MKIGFPRALSYYDYYPFWAGFFYTLGIELYTSAPTNRKIMEAGLKKAHDETCLPIKVLVGHLNSLEDVDAIFLPRLVSVEEKTYLCPKLLGLPESVLPGVEHDIPVLSVNVNWRQGKGQVLKELEKFGANLGIGKADVRKAFEQGRKWLTHYEELRRAGWDFQESIACFENLAEISRLERLGLAQSDSYSAVDESEGNRPTIALVGHPYLTYDSFANLNLLAKLKGKVNVKVIENVSREDIETHHKKLRKKMFWSHGKRIMGAGYSFVTDEEVDGIIYLSCFGCGSDSMTNDLLARQARAQHKPYMVITLDEHSGEAGMVTRVEAFLDMIERRMNLESNISAYGEFLDCNSGAL